MTKSLALVLILSFVFFIGAALTMRSPRSDHASEFMLDINSTATCTYWGQDKNGDDTALCKVQTYLVRCVAGPNTDKPACNAIVNLAPAPAPAPAPAGSGSGK